MFLNLIEDDQDSQVTAGRNLNLLGAERLEDDPG